MGKAPLLEASATSAASFLSNGSAAVFVKMWRQRRYFLQKRYGLCALPLLLKSKMVKLCEKSRKTNRNKFFSLLIIDPPPHFPVDSSPCTVSLTSFHFYLRLTIQGNRKYSIISTKKSHMMRIFCIR